MEMKTSWKKSSKYVKSIQICALVDDKNDEDSRLTQLPSSASLNNSCSLGRGVSEAIDFDVV